MLADHQGEPRPFKTFLNSSFTAISNNCLDDVFLTLPLAENRLLLVICRHSTGFLREWCYIGEQSLLDRIGVARSSLYAAKVSLVKKGIIEIKHSKRGCCLYRLTARFQALKVEAEADGVQLGGPPPVRLAGPMKESKETYMDHDHHHPQPSPSNDDDLQALFSSRDGAQFDTAAAEIDSVLDDQGSLESSEKKVPPAAELSGQPDWNAKEDRPTPNYSLVRRLQDIGVNPFMARRLVQTHPEHLITAALDRLRLASVKNPAGYLVAELSRGGYTAPIDPRKAIAEIHDKTHQRRKLERVQEEQSREISNRTIVQTPLEQFHQLPPGVQESILQSLYDQAERERFNRLPGWGADHPVWKGLLAEIVRQHELTALLGSTG